MTATSHLKKVGYDSYWVNHPSDNARGGVAILIKKEISHHVNSELQTESIQAISLTVVTNIGKVVFASVYCPPGPKIKREEFASFFKSLGERFVAGGD